MRFTRNTLLILAIGIIATGCSFFGGSNKPVYFEENRTYVNWLATSQEECDQLNDQGINCLQIVEFFTDGRAEIMMTDIVHPGTYTLINNSTQAVLKIELNPELPDKITFTVLNDGAQISDDLTGATWELE